MSHPSIESMIGAIPVSLGSYAPVLEEIETALQSQQCSLASLGEAIQRDPDLTARLLRLANSAFYGFSTRLSTVSEAVSLIGVQQVQELIVASSILERFTGVPEDFVNKDSFWRHSLACGIGARLLALEKHLPKPDKFFVAGLLHDVGRLVLLLQAPKSARQIYEIYSGGRMLLREAETRALGFDHQQIGGLLLQHWKYPPLLVEAVSYHHYPMLSAVAKLEASVVHLADHLVGAMGIGTSGERFVSALDERAWTLIGLAPDRLSYVMNGIDEQIEAVEDVFLKRRREEITA
jgi:HD-like signal output (HDOD) protein